MNQEFEEHDGCIKHLTEQVEAYKRDGREQAANRLREQLEHVKVIMIIYRPQHFTSLDRCVSYYLHRICVFSKR